MKLAFIVPAYQVEATIGSVVADLRGLGGPLRGRGHQSLGVVVVDDGSSDATADAAAAAGASLVRHDSNRGKGSALRTGFQYALGLGAEAAVSVDGDGQHPAPAALRVALCPAARNALVLGIRDMRAQGAPALHQTSNRIANFFLSCFGRHHFRDSQCGLRRYPLPQTLALGVRSDGYAFEAEVLLRALHAAWPIVEERVVAYYPPLDQRISHFHVVRDPLRIIAAVVATLAELHVFTPPNP
jgi:glycosyltransferase involved in cell wall biosynthesis